MQTKAIECGDRSEKRTCNPCPRWVLGTRTQIKIHLRARNNERYQNRTTNELDAKTTKPREHWQKNKCTFSRFFFRLELTTTSTVVEMSDQKLKFQITTKANIFGGEHRVGWQTTVMWTCGTPGCYRKDALHQSIAHSLPFRCELAVSCARSKSKRRRGIVLKWPWY